eukprot:m.5108 g.5108  ORF g.5108 m.5108 type:complete len:665 (+) comp12118_c0_seq2:1258-3252(+)
MSHPSQKSAESATAATTMNDENGKLDLDVHLQTDAVCAGRRGQFLVGLDLLVPEATLRVPVQVVPVLDVSSSMAEHLPLLKDGLVSAIEETTVVSEMDDFALVTFGFSARLQCASEGLGRMTSSRREKIIDGIRRMRTSGMTNLHGGLMAGLQQVKRSNSKFSFILLMTDGLASAGRIDPSDILSDVKDELEAIRTMGCHLAIYTMGLGHEHNSTLLREVAEVGGGEYVYVRAGDTLDLVAAIQEWLTMFARLRATDAQVSCTPPRLPSRGSVSSDDAVSAQDGIILQGMEEISFTGDITDPGRSPSLPVRRSSVRFGDVFSGTVYHKLVALTVAVAEDGLGKKHAATLQLSYRDAITNQLHIIKRDVYLKVMAVGENSSTIVMANRLIPSPIAVPGDASVNMAVLNHLAADLIRNAAIRMHRLCDAGDQNTPYLRSTSVAGSGTAVQANRAVLITMKRLIATLQPVIQNDAAMSADAKLLNEMAHLQEAGHLDECRAIANNFYQRRCKQTLSNRRNLATLFLNTLARRKRNKDTEKASDAKFTSKLAEKLTICDSGFVSPEIIDLETRLASKQKGEVVGETWVSSELWQSISEFKRRRNELLQLAGASWFGVPDLPDAPGVKRKSSLERQYAGAGPELLAAFMRRRDAHSEKTIPDPPKITEF